MKDKFYYKFTPKAKQEKIDKKNSKKSADTYDDFEENIKETKSPEVKSCKYYKKCSGCQLQNLDYESQLRHKQKQVDKLMSDILRPKKILGMDDPLHYRNKSSCAFSTDSNSRPIHGVFQSKTKHVVKVSDCMIQDKISNNIIKSLAKIVYDFKLAPYNSMKEKGFFRHVLIRRSFTTNEIMVVLVTKSVIFPAANSFTKALLKKHPEITTVVHCVNDTNIDMITGDTYKILHGKGYIIDSLMGLTFKVSPQSFYQVNPKQTEVLYSNALKLADIKKGDIIVDAYCGTGTIGLLAANRAKAVIGIENNRYAVKDAKENAKTNNIRNINFICSDATDALSQMQEENVHIDLIIMDPPRTGSDSKFIKCVAALKVKKVLYVSCNPQSLKYDLVAFTRLGYKLEIIQPVDMFPYTNHVESIAVLTYNEKAKK